MATNFQQHMGGMMPQQQQQQRQQQQQQQQQQQRPQNGNGTAAIQQMVLSSLSNQTPNPTGWQAQVPIQERMAMIFSVFGNLRLASQNQPNSPNLHKMVEIAMRFEREIFEKSPDKMSYKRAADTKLEQLLARRTENQAGLQASIQQQAQAQAQAHQAQAQQMMMDQNNMQGQVNRNMIQQPQPQHLQHLQHQMQASPIPGQLPPQMAMGMQNDGMAQNMNLNAQQQFQLQMQQQQAQQAQPNMAGRPQNPQGNNFSPQDNALIQDMVNQMMMRASDAEKNNIRATLQTKIDPLQLQRYQSSGLDIATLWYRNMVVTRLRADRQRQLALQQSQVAPPMQPQRSMNPSPLPPQGQPPHVPMGGNEMFMDNMENIVAQQQQQGLQAQQGGEIVVPVSNAPRNGTPQPGPAANQRVQQQQANQQQMFNAQQQRLQQQAALQQQQQQNQARMNAQAKAQNGLQGQPNGMGTGPVPPQQSPAMPNLNAPLRPPPQQMNQLGPEGQMNGQAPQFGQPLDPRFMQGNQNQRPVQGAGNGVNMTGINPAMIAGMAPEQQKHLASLPPEKFNEMVAKWTESQQRAQQMNMQNAQGLRPGVPMQGGRPGQQVPPGQFNPQTAAIQQFMSTNPGRPLPQALAAGISSQQLMMLQAQIQQRAQQQPNQLQRPNIPTSNEQRLMVQMDGMDFPPQVNGHAQMPRGIPADVKKWGQLKQWVSQNPNLGQAYMENIKTLQRMHYQNLVRTRPQQPNGANVQVPRGAQPGMQGVPPNMSVAPVAPMGPNPVQAGMPGQAIRPTQDEVNALRNHPSTAQMSEEQIVNFIQSRNAQMTPQQLVQRHQAVLEMKKAAAANLNQGRNGPPQPNQIATPQMQNQPPQMQPQPSIEQSAQAPNVNRQAPRPQAGNARNGPPPSTSSPAQPARNLKRASSDDVVEVPNPNLQQQRPAPQQAQAQAPNQAQQARPNAVAAQIAKLDPEARKKYEAMIRARQQGGASANQADSQMFRRIIEEESKRPAEPPIPMDQETKAATAAKLLAIVTSMNNVTKAIPRWYQITHDENKLRSFFYAKNRIGNQFTDAQMTTLKEVFSIRPQEVEQAKSMLQSIVKDLSAKFPAMNKKADNIQQQATNAQAAAASASTTQPAQGMPLNAANLAMVQQQERSKIHQRSTSRGSHPPAAPTSSQPPFAFGASSPHGTPAYIGKNTITQDNLHIPARKKQKQTNTNAAPGQTTPGSNVSKTVSPEAKRDQVRQHVAPALVCPEVACDRHLTGFETQEALNAHTQEEHIRPLQDPSKYALESVASFLGLDSQGKTKAPAATVGQESDLNMTKSASKQGQTPNIKGENTPSASTPMNRQVSMNRQASAAGSKLKVGLKESGINADPKDNKKEGSQAPEVPILDPWAMTTIDPQELFQAFQPIETGAGVAISDMNVYRSLSPNDTPESSNHVSEPNSDISDGVGLDISLDIFDDSWQPFGSGGGGEFDLEMGGINEDSLKMFDDEPQNYQTWDDIVDHTPFDKSFTFDTSGFSMEG